MIRAAQGHRLVTGHTATLLADGRLLLGGRVSPSERLTDVALVSPQCSQAASPLYRQ